MKRFFHKPLLLIILFTLIFRQQIIAQEIPAKQALELIYKNSSFLNLSTDDIQNVIVSNAYYDKISNTQLIYLKQSYKGIPVYNTIQVIALKNDKAISTSGGRLFKMEERVNVIKPIPAISGMTAVSSAAKAVGILDAIPVAAILRSEKNDQRLEFGPSNISKENITSDLLWVPGENGEVNLAWQVKILPKNSSDHWLILVNAKDGSVLGKVNLSVSCNWDIHDQKAASFINPFNLSEKNPEVNIIGNNLLNAPSVTSAYYRVIPYTSESMNHPGGTPVLINNPWLKAGASNAAVSLGWHNDGTTDYASTRGNNVWAKEDHAGNNSKTGVSAISTTIFPNLNFDFIFDKTKQPTETVNQNFATTQLFYLNNVMHDITYQYGFDEVSGNFQMNNQGRGGLENDFVFADAQDGSGKSNANFSTPADGSSPRMQMYLWPKNPYQTLKVNTPSHLAGYLTSVEGAISSANLLSNVGPVTGNVVLYDDDATATTHAACGTAFNAASLSGKIALIDRGNCTFIIKIKNAQLAGAKAVIMVNNQPGDTLITMSGTDNSIIIPAVMVFQRDGNSIKNAIGAGEVVNVTLTSADTTYLDGDLDNGIMAHEYTHGISSRLTGGASAVTCLNNAEQMGEGWSDYFALMITTDWSKASVTDGSKKRTIGTYVIDEDPATGVGIRTYPYTTDLTANPWTYASLKDIANSEPHTVGEIWAATLWDMTWNIIQTDNINPNLYNSNAAGGNSVALKLVTLGMKLQPCMPGFLDGRDAILRADSILYNGKYSCSIWSAFARRGMGVKAQQGSSNSTTDQIADYSIPASAVIKKMVDKSQSAQNDILTYTFKITSQCATILNYKIVDTLPGNVVYISGGAYDASSRTVTFIVANLPASQTQTFSFKVKINGTYFAASDQLNETIAGKFIPSTFDAAKATGWAASTVNHSAPYSLKADEPATAAEQILTSQVPYTFTGHTKLTFWQNYNTEASHDGGVVELSTDNGVSWFDAGPFMSQNGYNSTINTNTNLTNKRAFSGSSNGFIQTIINLTSFANKSVKFRFRFVTDNTVNGTGWYIDDIQLSNEAAVYNLAQLFDNTSKLRGISDTVTSITAQVLPLVWGSFEAEKNGKTSVLRWTTLQEINTDKFFVERSKDGIHFYTIATLNAAGNTNGVSSYHIIDATPFGGINFYRLRQTDRDGKYIYSEIHSVTFDEMKGVITVSPNPTKDHVVIYISGNKNILHVRLLNAVGQSLSIFTIKEENNFLSIPTLAAGVYYLKITGSNISSIQKLVIKK